MTKTDIEFMRMALALALKGRGAVNPNPLVGAVIVNEGIVVGRGWHKQFGGPHAEVEALHDAGVRALGSTIYVTLEPCSHYGKTPPCALALIEAQVSRVVIASLDPNPLVAGRGIDILKQAGIAVETGVLDDLARYQNRVFRKYIQTGLPYVMLKSAMTLDGKIATTSGDSRWVSGEQSRAMVHAWRNEFKAIMVGINTVLKDDPMLNTRLVDGGCRNPVRIVLDSLARIPMDCRLVNSAREIPLWLIVTSKASEEKLSQLRDHGVMVVKSSVEEDGKIDLRWLMHTLGDKNIDSVLLEGGGELNYSALATGIVDEVAQFIAPKIVGGGTSLTPVGGQGISLMRDAISTGHMRVTKVGDDVLINSELNRY